ncbi:MULTISPECIES: ankyrin repeat domain-containing protein [unclassified Imperialibacter]|uniref:ankyrin repeat domain-containing protein n=1 Tax=unclassified Imperialibacter TaxID=2629706 RepID=UPI0012567CFB|nr:MULTISPECIES: ankyrin repeat domain-containing protein [unclassified Imperialibacter]CAD5251264.1 Ankyrin repeat-containing protein [Imperialibacter sp. 89]CAD5284319.1 Ankyrin repeat-containing protein [Imperialibacter sp. 75]VVT11086.1 Ankyrin repeat-containing protein [Imperialibacter sp. EC-SDR9]
MKTMMKNTMKTMTRLALVAALLVTVACSDKKVKSESTSESSAVAAPDVDIHTAVISGNIEAVKQHIAASSNLNEKDPFGGSSPLISAAVFGKPEAAKLLIDAGADINFQNNDGSTALISAAFFCRPEIVQMLLDKGADKSIKNKYGATAYDGVSVPYADVKGSYEMMATMLAPMGLKLDYAYIEKTRPEVAAMLN